MQGVVRVFGGDCRGEHIGGKTAMEMMLMGIMAVRIFFGIGAANVSQVKGLHGKANQDYT
jgi:hypothetical protein